METKPTNDNSNPPATSKENDTLSEEDKTLLSTLEMIIERLSDNDSSLHRPALEALRTQIRASAVSLTSVPKALKFLRFKFNDLTRIYETCLQDESNRKFLADILSVISMTLQPEPIITDTTTNSTVKGLTLKYRLLGEGKDIGDWGHEYVRHLSMQIMDDYEEEQSSKLLPLAKEVAVFFLEHNSEPDACDLLYEIGHLPMLVDLLPGHDHVRVCLYLLSCVPYEADGDDRVALQVAHSIYLRFNDLPNAMITAMRMNDHSIIKQVFLLAEGGMRRQLAFLLARNGILFNVEEDSDIIKTLDEDLVNILNNTKLTDHFKSLAKDLEITAAKSPEDIFKSHLQDSLRVTMAPSPRNNLASSFVNAFVNAGFGTDTLLLTETVKGDEGKSWIYRVKDHGLLSTVASLALIHLWNPDAGLAELDKYLYSENIQIKAGAVLGIGLCHSGIRNESDPALALLREYIEDDSSDKQLLISSLMGLALAYCASARKDVADVIVPLISHSSIQVASMAALAVGHVFVGKCEGDYASFILQTMMERTPEELSHPQARFLALALALLYLGKTENHASVILDTLAAVEHPIAKDAAALVKICSYAGSGNVLKIQELLSKVQSIEGEGESGCFSVIGISLICMMEDIGKEMSHRLFTHLMHHGSPSVRKAVPLAIALLYTSHPNSTVMDLLSKYSHDADKPVAVNAIFALGLIAAGTNNAKTAQMLRQLAAYYQRDADCLYVVRLAQALVHAAKGTVSLSPIHCHRQLFHPAALAGLLTTIIAFTDAQSLLLENSSFLLYFLVPAMYPRFVITLDETLAPKPILVRVGQAVDVVGQAGKPKTITGFQTHTSPVLLGYQDRAELATEEFIPLSTVLENFVIVRKNPDYQE